MSEIDLCPVCRFYRSLSIPEIQPGSGGIAIYARCECGRTAKTLKEAAKQRIASLRSEIARLEAWLTAQEEATP